MPKLTAHSSQHIHKKNGTNKDVLPPLLAKAAIKKNKVLQRKDINAATQRDEDSDVSMGADDINTQDLYLNFREVSTVDLHVLSS